MKAIEIIFLFCLTVLPSIIQGGRGGRGDSGPSTCGYMSTSSEELDTDKPLRELQVKVDEIIENGGTINKVFKPLQFIGMGGFSLNYKGELGQSKQIVAMKISPISMMEGETLGEYLMYTYMKAINNASVEDYGIPAVYYYYADWEGYTLLALSLLEPTFTDLINAPNVRLGDLNILIIMREFVRISKYIHSSGVCHGDMHLNNIMFRKNQAFIIDFNWASEVNLGFDSNSDCRKRDWKRLLHEVCPLCGVAVDTNNEANTVKNIVNMKNNDGLRFVLGLFARYAIRKDVPINYNKMYQIITREIQRRGVQEPALVSWITNAQKNEASTEWLTKRPPAIETIAEPKLHYNYPEPILDYFHDLK